MLSAGFFPTLALLSSTLILDHFYSPCSDVLNIMSKQNIERYKCVFISTFITVIAF